MKGTFDMLFILKMLSKFNTKYAYKYAKKIGVEIGENVRLFSTNFGTEPYLIKIGDHVTVSGNVSFITHDGGTWVLRRKHGNINFFGKVVIGSNVFIGSGAIILPGVTIGDNVIIGAGSIVTKSFEGNQIIAGNPARIIGPLEKFENKINDHGINMENFNGEKKKYVISQIDRFLKK